VEQVKKKLYSNLIMNSLFSVCGLFFAAAAKQLSLANRPGKAIESLSDAFEAGIQSVESYARVQPGDKSLLDALIPVVDFIKSKRAQQSFSSQDWKQLAMIAERAAQGTKHLVAKVGRAAYTKSVDILVADPGACAIAIILHAISDVFVKGSSR
jgi:dihydroxyacetone kinase-like protein